MIVKDVTGILEELAPLSQAEDFDNVGLLVGDAKAEVTGILVTLDTLENVIDEAIEKSCNLVVSFHPIIFGGLKKLTGKTYVERVVMKAIANDINIYAIHTALDNAWEGVNAKICEVLGLGERAVLIPKKGSIRKLMTYVPKDSAEDVREALFAAGAGHIGKYSHCSFNLRGTGSFRAEEGSNPTLGEIGSTHFEEEIQVQVVFQDNLQDRIIAALKENHPYEEVAYEVLLTENLHQEMGMGMVGELEGDMDEEAFLQLLKDRMHAKVVRHTELTGKRIRKVAVLGGSGAFAIGAAKAAGADALVTSDLKYHQFYEAEKKILLADIGHFESEQFTKTLLVDYLTKKIPNFAISLSESITNPIKYF
ncbi:MAG: Nif3-like dinuclear metal center hexameric protein [Flavobacteriaceae bacterium]|nr:Nif3-like dinuclear metal center hexameric protein [Flavobacteriaceae bacterium]